MLDALDASAVRRWSRAALDSMRAHQAEIDALNVFPVPDGDTGTNLLLTLLVADDAAQSSQTDVAAEVLAELARAAVLGARGNSGVIVSQYFRGLAEASGGAAALDADAFGRGLRRGADLADQAVGEPAEGTILTVAHAAAEAAIAAAGRPLAQVVGISCVAAGAALARTRDQLPALREAGVVDAGARGFVLLLEALAEVVTEAPAAGPHAAVPAWSAVTRARESGSPEFGYEVQYLLDADRLDVDGLRARLGRLGDSVAVVGTGEGTWNVHVHVNDVGAALEAGMAAGRPHRVSVLAFADHGPGQSSSRPAMGSIGVVAVAPGDGLAHLFEKEGVLVVADEPPSTADVLAAVHAAGAPEVVVLATGRDAAEVAEAGADVARHSGVRVAVVPTRSPVQSLAAVAVHDATRRFDEVVVAMAEAAAATRFAVVEIAAEQALTSVGVCEAGDVLGLIDGEVVEIGHGILPVAFALTDRLLGVGAELLTVVTGRDAPAGLGDVVTRHVRERAPFTDVAVYVGNHPAHPVIIGAE